MINMQTGQIEADKPFEGLDARATRESYERLERAGLKIKAVK